MIVMKFHNIRISEDTKLLLDEVRHEGQSYNGLLRELMGKRDTKLAKRQRRLAKGKEKEEANAKQGC